MYGKIKVKKQGWYPTSADIAVDNQFLDIHIVTHWIKCRCRWLTTYVYYCKNTLYTTIMINNQQSSAINKAVLHV